MAFPEDPLGAVTEFQIGGVWTDVTQHALTRNIITHTRGRTAEGQAVDPASCSLLLNSPNGLYSPRNPRSPYFELIGPNTPMRISLFTGNTYVWLPDLAGNQIATPDVAALDITGDIDVRIDLTLKVWNGVSNMRELAGKYAGTGSQRSWALFTWTDGRLLWRWSADGTNTTQYLSPAAITVPSSGRLAVRATLDVDNGAAGHTLTWYTAPTIAGPWTMLGTPDIHAGTTSIFSSSAPLAIGDVTELGFERPAGRVHAFELRNGIAGSVVANPDFTVQTPGAATVTDGSGRVWTPAGGAEVTNRQIVFSGEFSDWPPEWSPTGALITVDGEGAGILRRMSQGTKSLDSTLRRRIPSYSPIAYWPMEEGSEATTAFSPITGVKAFKPTALGFASDDTLPGSSALPVVQVGASFVATVPPAPAGTWQVELVYNLDAMPVALTTLFEVRATGTARRVRARVATNQVVIDGLDTDDATVFTSTTTAPQFTGAWTRLQIKAVQTGGNVQYVFRWIIIGGTGFSVNTTIAAVPGYVTSVRSSFGTGLDGMRFGHLAVFNSETDTPFNSADSGFSGETAGARMLRLCAEEGIPFSLASNAGDTARMGAQRPGALLSLLAQCEEADGGVLVEDRERTGLRFRGRQSQYNQAPALALVYGDRGLARPLEPVEADQVRNDITVDRTGGGSGRAVLEAGRLSVQDPPNGVTRYDDAVELNLYDDDQAEPMAYWLLHLGTWDEARYPVVRVKLHRAPSLIPAVLALNEGDMIRLTDLPDWQPPGPVDLIVQGWTERIGTRTWEIDLVCAPAGPWNVGVVGDTVRGIVETSGSTLATAVTSTVTTLPVLATNGREWLWETAFDVRVGGEDMTVSAIGPYVADTFGRTVANGWGAADTGQTWTVTGTAADYAVGSGYGSATQPSVGVAHLTLTPAPAADVNLYVDVAASALATGASLFAGPLVRAVDNNNHYAARLNFTTAAAISLSIRKRVAGVETEIGLFASPLAHVAGTFYRVRFQVIGTALKAKVWATTAYEPAQWQIEVTDSALTAAANLGTRSFSNTGNTNVSPQLRFDNMRLVGPQKFTVARSTNGVVKAHAAAAPLRAVQPARVAL